MNKIGIVLKDNADTGLDYAVAAIDFLIKEGVDVYIGEKNAKKIKRKLNKKTNIVAEEEVFAKSEAVIVYGGDGTVMRISHQTSEKGIALLGVNLGRVGYLADIEPEEYELLSGLVKGNYEIEERMMISVTLVRDGKKIIDDICALNDVVLSKGALSVMSEIELNCNGDYVGKYFADGLIIATPTGSTAYSLAAGGPVVDTQMDCICITPICPQSFYAKPIIFSGNSVLEFKKGERGHGKLFLTVDGGQNIEIKNKDVLYVKKSKVVTKIIHIKKNNFCNILRSKMSDI